MRFDAHLFVNLSQTVVNKERFEKRYSNITKYNNQGGVTPWKKQVTKTGL
jgi:hypothetical protein